MALSLFSIRQPRRMGKVRRWHHPFLTFPIRFRSGSRDGLGKYALPLPATGQDCRRGKARRWHYPYSGSGSRDGLGKYALPLPATGQRCRRGKARRWHRVLLLSPSYISTVPLSRPSRPSLSVSLSPPIYTCAA